MERHVDALDAPTVYGLVGLVGRYCTPTDAARIAARYADRLVQRIPPLERDEWDLADIPAEPVEGIARFLYALMSDVDVRTRWRAAHALRCLARLGDALTLDKLVGLYSRTSEPSYRAANAPFYWIAARLWLVMALARIAAEKPATLEHHGQLLLTIATDEDFPHILIRSFAKSALSSLVESGVLTLNLTDRRALKRANTSPIPRRIAPMPYSVGFDAHTHPPHEERRFHFDTMDTLPYWYTGALRAFANLSAPEFLDVAERWIVDRWGIRDNPWRWDDEPRKQRLSDRSLPPMDHGHGALPILERFHTYLEWHAMWCTTGALMRTCPLATAAEDAYYGLEQWLSREGLTASPLWLADLRGMKPLEARLWFPPRGDVDAWVESVSDDDFLPELGLVNGEETIIASGYHDTRSRSFRSSVQIRTALVSPGTARALVRALQTVDDSWDYRIPSAGDNLEIDVSPYKLVGWLADSTHDAAIDEHDMFRYGIRGIECRPSTKAATTLHLNFLPDDQPRWVEPYRRKTVLTYEAWGDNRGDEREDRLCYDETVRSGGWRLRVDKEELRAFLKEVNLDLIAEIEITRRNRGYEHSWHDEETAKEARFDRVVLLRRDGTIEAAEGPVGTWTAPRP